MHEALTGSIHTLPSSPGIIIMWFSLSHIVLVDVMVSLYLSGSLYIDGSAVLIRMS